MDSMSNEELITRLRNECCLPYQTLKLMRMAAKAIEDLEASTKICGKFFGGKWIRVSDELPDICVNVLVTDGRSVGMGWVDENSHKDIYKIERVWCAPNTDVDERNITHWMALPDVPNWRGK